MSDFKSKLIKGFRKGQGYNVFSPESYRVSTCPISNDGEIMLPRSSVTSAEIAATTSGDTRIACNAKAACMVLTNPSTGFVEIWQSYNGVVWTKVKTMPFGFTSAQYIFAKKGSDIMIFFDAGYGNMYRSLDSGDTWAAVTLPGSFGLPTDVAYHEGYVYFGENETNVTRTKDFVTWETIHTFLSGSDIFFFTIGSVLFARSDDKIYRKTEQDTFVLEYALSAIPFHYYYGMCTGDDVAVFFAVTTNGNLVVYRYDGELQLLRTVPWTADIRARVVIDGYAYFVKVGSTNELYALDIETGAIYFVEFFPTVTAGTSHDFDPVVIFGERLYVCEQYAGGPISSGKLRVSKSANYSLSAATLETGEIDMATHAPRRLVLRHNPLLAGHTVKVYVRFDRVATYTLILTSDTDGAVIKTYDWAAGAGPYEFVEFKIELQTTDTTTSPGGIDLEYVYLPLSVMK